MVKIEERGKAGGELLKDLLSADDQKVSVCAGSGLHSLWYSVDDSTYEYDKNVDQENNFIYFDVLIPDDVRCESMIIARTRMAKETLTLRKEKLIMFMWRAVWRVDLYSNVENRSVQMCGE